jgi:hypothetical protein
MTAGAHYSIRDLTSRGIPFWLPPGGVDNGLWSASWAAILDAPDEHSAALLLVELKDAGVPAYAAALHRPVTDVRIWVGCDAYGRAETALLHILPNHPGWTTTS